MAIVISNVTINNQLTIINDADISKTNPNNGPKYYSGTTEADVIIDGKGYLNLQGDDVIPSNVHAFQYRPATSSGWIEFDGNAQNQDITADSIPSWVNTMVTRWNAEKVYNETYETVLNSLTANIDGNSATYSDEYAAAVSNATSQATTAKNNILGV